MLIRIVAADLAELILGADQPVENVDGDVYDRLVKAADELITLRSGLWDVLGFSAARLLSDTELVGLVQKLLTEVVVLRDQVAAHEPWPAAPMVPAWRCEECSTDVPENVLVCPTCVREATPDTTGHHQTDQDQDPDQSEFWDRIPSTTTPSLDTRRDQNRLEFWAHLDSGPGYMTSGPPDTTQAMQPLGEPAPAGPRDDQTGDDRG